VAPVVSVGSVSPTVEGPVNWASVPASVLPLSFGAGVEVGSRVIVVVALVLSFVGARLRDDCLRLLALGALRGASPVEGRGDEQEESGGQQ